MTDLLQIWLPVPIYTKGKGRLPMISPLTTQRENVSSTGETAAQSFLRINKRVSNQGTIDPVTLSRTAVNSSVQGSQSGADNAVSVDFSVSHDVFSAVDNFFNLGTSGRFDAFHALSPTDKEQFVKVVAALAQSGYVGYEDLVVNNKVERHDLTTQIGDQRLYHARVYDNSKDPHR